MRSSMTAEGLYIPSAPVQPVETSAAARSSAHPTRGSGEGVSDPHDKDDMGPSDWFDDPVVWLVGIAALASGVVGIRFNWFKGRASVDVNMGDELASIVGQTLFTIVGILLFKVLASKIEVPGLQKVAAAI